MRESLWAPSAAVSTRNHAEISTLLELTVVNKSTNQVVLLKHGECVKSLGLGHEVGAFNVFGTGEEIVELGTCPEVGRLPPLVDRNHNREP